jgi:hypothetical protein
MGGQPKFTCEVLKHDFYTDAIFHVHRNGLLAFHAKFWGQMISGTYRLQRRQLISIYAISYAGQRKFIKRLRSRGRT